MTALIRPATEADHDALRPVVTAAFTDHGPQVARLVELLRSSGHVRAELVCLEKDGEKEAVVGHVLLSHSWLDARERLVDVLVLSPLSVRPDRQRSGLGTRLLAAAVEEARRLGAPLLFLEGSPDYYGARGFSRGDALGFVRPSVRIPQPAFQVLVLDGHEPRLTGALVYCEPFWALDCVGLRDPRLRIVEQTFGN